MKEKHLLGIFICVLLASLVRFFAGISVQKRSFGNDCQHINMTFMNGRAYVCAPIKTNVQQLGEKPAASEMEV